MKQELMKAVEEIFIDEITDVNNRTHIIYCGCVVEHYYYPEGNGIVYDHSIILYSSREIRIVFRKEPTEVCEAHLANYSAVAYDARIDASRGK